MNDIAGEWNEQLDTGIVVDIATVWTVQCELHADFESTIDIGNLLTVIRNQLIDSYSAKPINIDQTSMAVAQLDVHIQMNDSFCVLKLYRAGERERKLACGWSINGDRYNKRK